MTHKCSVFVVCAPKIMMNHFIMEDCGRSVCGSLCTEHFCRPCCLDASAHLLSQQPSNLHTNEHLNGLNDIIDSQLEIFLSWSLCTGRTTCTKWEATHTHTQKKWLLFCILMRVISCRLAMADKGTYLCPGPQCLTGGKCPLQRPALIVSEHVVRLIIIIIMGN